jgi:hypothetical protein
MPFRALTLDLGSFGRPGLFNAQRPKPTQSISSSLAKTQGAWSLGCHIGLGILVGRGSAPPSALNRPPAGGWWLQVAGGDECRCSAATQGPCGFVPYPHAAPCQPHAALHAACQPYANSMRPHAAPCRPHAAPCQPHANANPMRPHANPMPTPFQPHAAPCGPK